MYLQEWGLFSTEPMTEGIRGSHGKARVTPLRGSPIISGHTVGPQVAPLVPAAPAGLAWLAGPGPLVQLSPLDS